MRIATYNVEWFSNLFDDDGALLDDQNWSGRHDVRRADQIAALGAVFQEIDADAVMVIEAPDSHRKRSGVQALETFAKRFGLRTSRAIDGFVNDTQQEIALLFDPGILSAVHDPQGGTATGDDAPRFDESFSIDLDIDATPDRVRWSKPPLELAVETTSGQTLRMIGVHAKSKAPHGARSADAIMRVSIANRRKQLAQCIWLRRRVDQHLEAGDNLIVLGDFNDGPGLDEYERLFGRSGVEIVIGEEGHEQLFDPHARQAMTQRIGHVRTTARFYQADTGRYIQALLDYIMISKGLRSKRPEWRIWHPFDDAACYDCPNLRDALLTASDHFPVTLDLEL